MTPSEFCAVTAVITDMPWTPKRQHGLEIGLDTGTAPGIGAGDGQGTAGGTGR